MEFKFEKEYDYTKAWEFLVRTCVPFKFDANDHIIYIDENLEFFKSNNSIIKKINNIHST
jgi:hypothetical protein